MSDDTKREQLILDYAVDYPSTVWDTIFESGDAICVTLHQPLSDEEISAHVGGDGPWGWGGFTTAWVESIAEEIASVKRDSGMNVIFSRPGERETREDQQPVTSSDHEVSVASLRASVNVP